jgi:hypothetical protein
MKILHSYSTVDKSSWGDGEWQNEPDKVQWRDERTGLPCIVRRQPRLGFLCGYVGVPEGHPLYGRECYLPEVVHDYEINYANACQDGPEAESICHIPEPGEPDHIWWFGFDCAQGMGHAPGLAARDLATFPEWGGEMKDALANGWEVYRTLGHVEEQCAVLAVQLAAAS